MQDNWWRLPIMKRLLSSSKHRVPRRLCSLCVGGERDFRNAVSLAKILHASGPNGQRFLEAWPLLVRFIHAKTAEERKSRAAFIVQRTILRS
jgi:hypothetical protein